MNNGYIFDYGGTLDTGGDHWGRVIWDAYQAVGIAVSEAHYREAYVYAERTLASSPIIMPYFSFRQTLEAKLKLQMDFITSNLKPQTSNLKPLTSYLTPLTSYLYTATQRHTYHSYQVLQQLPGQKVLVSNFYGNIHTVLSEFGFDHLFQHVIESAVVGVRKPDPRIFAMGVEALGLQPEQVTVVGDSIDKDIVPAASLGCQTVWISGRQWTDAPVDSSRASRIISQIDELLQC